MEKLRLDGERTVEVSQFAAENLPFRNVNRACVHNIGTKMGFGTDFAVVASHRQPRDNYGYSPGSVGEKSGLMEEGSGHRPDGFYRFGANPEEEGGRQHEGCHPPVLRSWPLGRRSGRFPPLPYPPLRSAAIVAFTKEKEETNKYTAARFSVMDVVVKHHPPESHDRATEDYPQFRRALQVLRLQESTMGRPRDKNRDRSTDRAPSQQSRDLLRLRLSRTRLRPFGRAPIRVRAVVANRGLFRIHHASGRLSQLWCEGGTSALVRRQEPIDNDLPLVPLAGWAKSAFVEGSRRRIRYDVAERVSVGKTRGFMGINASGAEGDRGDRRRRSAVAKGAQVFDVGLSDRRWLEASVMDSARIARPRLSCGSSGCWEKSVRAS